MSDNIDIPNTAKIEDSRIIALIPAYEPEELMITLLKELSEEGIEAIVVDDGSKSDKDSLFAEAAEYAAVLRHSVNRGKGAAIKTGLSYISEHYRKDAAVVTMDADGQHKVSDARKVASAALENPGALIIGGRRFTGDVPLRSRMGNTITRYVFFLSTGRMIYDTQTGLRAFTAESIPYMLGVEGDRYEYEMNVLMRCAREGLEMIEIPIETVYIGDNSSSHFDTIKDSYRIYKEIIKFSASSILSFLIDYSLYSVFLIAFGRPLRANVLARVISASANFLINKRLVFRTDGNTVKDAGKYALLAIVILALNTGLLKLLTGILGIGPYIAKIIVEIILFILSYLVQKNLVFCKRGDTDEKN
ncbi:MAG: bifunctional glycosyltransferase family 2/GtrA family protein [Clostridia bacterium]|nr:bifunctional glycosyltransferase family 2/GtrA family protein [Clostridia bacterium]